MKKPSGEYDRSEKKYKVFLTGARAGVNILVLILLIVVVIFLAGKACSLGYEVTSYTPLTVSDSALNEEITITSDMSIKDVGKLLIEKNIVNESLEAFLIQEKLSDYHDSFIPGTYTLNPSMTIDEILKTISTDPEAEDDNR